MGKHWFLRLLLAFLPGLGEGLISGPKPRRAIARPTSYNRLPSRVSSGSEEDFDVQSRINRALQKVDSIKATSYASKYSSMEDEDSSSSSRIESQINQVLAGVDSVKDAAVAATKAKISPGEESDFDYESRVNRALSTVDAMKGTSYAKSYAEPRGSKSSLEHAGGSRLFLDTADTSEWANYLRVGFFWGVTTNPVLLQRAGVACTLASVAALARTALEDFGCREFMIQAWGGTTENLIKTGRAIGAFDPVQNRIVVKVPCTVDGFAAATVLGGEGVRICMTACYNQEQAFMAAGLGAEYVAPYLGRMTDSGKDGLEEVAAMNSIVKGMGAGTRVFVASLRNPSELTRLAARGLDTYTFAPNIAKALLEEPLTTVAAADFEAAAVAMGGDEVE